MEDDELALLYNDQSIAENRSLTIGFRELLKQDYANLRKVMFKEDPEYRRFRQAATQIVLTTDIASPERTQIRKSKWKEAFGEDFQTVEAKIKQELKRRSMGGTASGGNTPARRMSAASIFSELQELPEIIDSLTNTPEPSETGEETILEYDKTALDGHEKGAALEDEAPPIPGFNRNLSVSSVTRFGKTIGRAGSTPATGRTHPDDEGLGYSDNFKKFQRRLSSTTGQRRGTRLGIARSIDLSGEFIDNFSRRSTISAHALAQPLPVGQEEEEEAYDDLKVSAILEQIITVADIAHVFQGWSQMEKFSNRLFLELKRAHHDGRGPHPKPNWFENQISFLESYNLPLAHRLEDTGIFGPLVGPVFAKLVEANRDQWIDAGQEVTDEIIKRGAEVYPVEGE